MIKQIELPSAALVRERIEEVYAKWNAKQIAYEDWQRLEKEAKAKRVNAEAELSRLLDEGFTVIERYPFSIGDGLHLVLYKSDKPFQQAINAENIAKAGPPPTPEKINP